MIRQSPRLRKNCYATPVEQNQVNLACRWHRTGLKLKDVLPRFTNEAINVIENHEKKSNDKPLFLYQRTPPTHAVATVKTIGAKRCGNVAISQ